MMRTNDANQTMTDGRTMQMTTGKQAMTVETLKATGSGRLRSLLIAAVLGLTTLGLLAAPQAAHAWPLKGASCTGCHTADDTDATIATAINGAAATTISGVTPGQIIEIDWLFTNIREATKSVGVEIAVPTGWTVAPGTVNTPTGLAGGWNPVWDVASRGNSAGYTWSITYSTATQFPNSPAGASINFEATSWATGTSKTGATDDGSTNDRDGDPNRMGTDARVTVPAGTATGTYEIVVSGIGHTAANARARISQVILVTVAGADATPPVAGTVAVSPRAGNFVPATFTITTPFTDAESPVTSCQYTLNGVSWVAGSAPTGSLPNFTCTATPPAQSNGAALTINMRAISTGGTGTATAITPNQVVDTVAPTTTSDAPAGWQAADVNVTLTPTDGGSGVAGTEYCVDTANSCVPGTAGTSVSVTQAADSFGTQYVRFRSTDNLGAVEATKSATVQIDKTRPTDGALTVTPGNTQNGLSWTAASDTGSGLRTASTYDVRFLTGGTPPTCSPLTGTSIYTGTGTTTTHSGLTNSQPYSYAVCAYDNANNVSTGATGSGTPDVVCTSADPTVTIVGANMQITSAGGTAIYTVEVTNNDSNECADTTFSLSKSDSDATSFQASVLGTASLLVAPGATQSTTLTVTATGSPTNGAVNDSSVSTAAAGSHGAVTSNVASTLINLPRTPTMHYNIGENVHIEFRTSTRFNAQGVGGLSIWTSDSTPVLTNANMLETQVGAIWVYTFDWDTTGQPADSYRIKVWDSTDANPSPNLMVILDNPSAKLSLFADAGYTTPTDIFGQGVIVYAEVLLPSPESATAATDITNWYNAGETVPTLTVTETGTRYRFNFTVDFAGASVADGDWAWFYWKGQDTGFDFHRPIQRNDAGCNTCTYAIPTVSILTGNQTIVTDGGTVDYTINVTNNDSVACGSTSFDLLAVDTNSANFNPSIFGSDPLAVGPGLTGVTVMTVEAKAGQPNGSTNDSYFYTALDVNHAQSANSNSVTTDISVADVTPPVVTAFSVPATSTSLAVPITTFTATDAIGVTGYMVTESATAPLPGDGGWLGAAPATFTVAGEGPRTLYAWAKDAAGNVSTSLSAAVTVDATAPVVSSFTVPATSTSLTVSVTQFLATDGIGVTGYMITTSATPPTSGDAGWLGSAPASYTVGGDGSYTFYPWAKDALGNVSAVYGAPQAVLVDTTSPSVSSTSPVNAAPAAPLDGNVTINFSEPVDCGTVNATNIVSDSPGWAYDGTSCIISGGSQAIFTVSGQAYSTAYAVSVTSAVKDPVGNSLSPAPYNISFTTEAEACVYGTPAVSIVTPNQNATVDGDVVSYTLSIINTDTGACGNTIFSLVKVDSNATDFDPSTFDVATITLAPSSSGSRTLQVRPKVGSLNGASNDTYFYTAADGNHAQSANSGAVTTIIAVPCDVAPTATIITADQQITTEAGSAVYTVQVQNDNAQACGATAFNLVAVDDNSTSFTTPSVFTVDPLTVNPGGGTNTTVLTVSASAGAANSEVNNSYFYTTLNGTIPASANSNVVSTTINRPCVRNAPEINHAVDQNIAPDGSAIYTLTVTNKDVDCGATTFGVDLLPGDETGAVASFNLPSVLSNNSLSVAAQASNSTLTLTVTGNGTGAVDDQLVSRLTLSSPSHAAVTWDVKTTIKQFNPLVHSSLSTASSKHLTSGGWGIAGGKYGEFSCATCHVPTTSNIKRVRSTLPDAPDTSKGNFPGAGATIAFLDAQEPATDFGDDAASHASSNKICQVCHTYDPTDPRDDGVKHHAFNMPVSASHENNKDCIACHKHNAGFAAAGGSCDSCHGYPPNPGDAYSYQSTEGKGAHVKHVNHLAALAGVVLDPNGDSFGDANTSVVCGVCHDMNATTHEMSGGTRNINYNGSTAFQFGPAAPAYNGVQGDPSATTPKTCSNISCHFQASPWWE